MSGAVWHTSYHITYCASRPLDDSILSALSDVDFSLSAFNPRSIVSSVNAGKPVKVDSLFCEVFECAGRINELSGGCFDPTVAPLVNLWGFGFEAAPASEPTQEMIDSVLPLVGMAGCRVTPDMRVEKAHPLTRFDFSSIAKGYACDYVARMLRRNGCTDFMVEIGGEICLGGKSPKGKEWRIQIDAPEIRDDGTDIHSRMLTVNITDCGIATSGNYRNYRDTPSHGRVGHTISPLTGLPFISSTLSASIIAPDAVTADALATAVMAMPTEDALEMLGKLDDVAALLVTVDPDTGKWTLIPTGDFPL